MKFSLFFAVTTSAVGVFAHGPLLFFPNSTNSTDTAPVGPMVTASGATTAIPSGAKMNQGAYTVTARPQECTTSSAPYQIGLWVNSTQMNIEDDGGWWGATEPVPWTFSTNTSNVVFGMPAFTGNDGGMTVLPNVSQRLNGNSMTVNMAKSDLGQNLFFNVWNTNGTNFTTWEKNTTQQGTVWQPVPFFLNIAGSAPCKDPVGNTSCQANTIQRTPDQWLAYNVDDFLSSWIQNNTDAFKTTPMIQKFVSDFNIGNGQACTFSSSCELIDLCTDLPDGGKDPDSPMIYLSLIALQNLSDLFNRMWQALSIGEADTMTQIAQISMQYHQLNSTSSSTNPSPWWASSSAMGLVSSVLGVIPGGGAISGVVGVASSIAAVVYEASDASSSVTFPDTQANTNEANVASFLGDYVMSVRNSIEDTYNSIFVKGTNVTQLLHGGGLVNRTSLQLDCSDCQTQQENWLEQYLTLKTINEIWIQQNAFITFMPYGNITQVDTYQTVEFTESDCASNFLNNPDDQALTICHTDDFGWTNPTGAGMARLNWYWPDDPKTVMASSNGYGALNISYGPPGFDNATAVLNTTGASTYTFKPVHAIESSIRGFIKGGLGYDGVANSTANMVRPGSGGNTGVSNNMSAIALEIWNMNATTAGMFNIPICYLNDLNRWPTYWSTPNRIGGDYYSVCQGFEDQYHKKFEDYVGQELNTILNTLFISGGTTQHVDANEILGGEDGYDSRRVRRRGGFFGLW